MLNACSVAALSVFCLLLTLSVRVRHPGARRVYPEAGFADHGELYPGGWLGPQHIMVRELNSAEECAGAG